MLISTAIVIRSHTLYWSLLMFTEVFWSLRNALQKKVLNHDLSDFPSLLLNTQTKKGWISAIKPMGRSHLSVKCHCVDMILIEVTWGNQWFDKAWPYKIKSWPYYIPKSVVVEIEKLNKSYFCTKLWYKIYFKILFRIHSLMPCQI